MSLAWVRRSNGSSARGLLTRRFVAHYVGKLWIVAEFALVLALLGSGERCVRARLLGLRLHAGIRGAASAIPGQLGVLEAALKGSAVCPAGWQPAR